VLFSMTHQVGRYFFESARISAKMRWLVVAL
jgi:hypothetical protein